LLENLRIVGGFDESLIVELRVFEPERPIVELKSMHFEGEGGPVFLASRMFAPYEVYW